MLEEDSEGICRKHEQWRAREGVKELDFDSKRETERDVLEEDKTKIKVPSMYEVVMLNDDYTPMDFVVDVLIKFFDFDLMGAEQTMITIHEQGKAVCGVYTRDIAETKTIDVNKYARDASYPLLCEIEEA